MSKHFILLLFFTQNFSIACKNFIGNPHKTALPSRTVSTAKSPETMRVEPPNWWIGMKNREVEILFHREDIANFEVKMGKFSGVKILKIEKTDSPNYLFITLDISPKAKPGTLAFNFSKNGFVFSQNFPLLARNEKPKAQGVNPSDIIYLIFPDRFSNGDPSNDNVPGMLEGLQRDSLIGRHGGDLQGVIDHLDYLQDLGVTTIWLNPELENNQSHASYHGYAVTDHYRVDRRFGTNDLLKKLVEKCHERGMKVVRDVVFNHIGDGHYWMKDLPAKDWINQWPTFTKSNFRAPTVLDPYASERDKKQFSDGWFDRKMPDVNQRNPHVAKYLTQQTIWWTEYAGLDDFRIDTYPYSDQNFCSAWCKAMTDEYPKMKMFGEIWEHSVAITGFFADNQPMQRANFDSNLPSVVDFQWCFAVQEMLNREQGWTEGAARLYYVLAQDYFYENPLQNVIMVDNHDFTRFFTTIGENFDKFKSGMALLFTSRGVPQIYYATEILGTGNEHPSHGNIRKDFPGGWPGDAKNKFTAAGRTDLENEAFNFTRTLIHYRNATTALQTGKLMQFVPENSVYTFFRFDEKTTVMTIVNSANSEKTIEMSRFSERTVGFSKLKNVVTGEILAMPEKLTIPKNAPFVFELLK